MTPTGGAGQYALTASATAPGIGPLATTAYCELADTQDLAIAPGDIQLSRNLPQPGDSLTIYATVHNNSSTEALGVAVEVRDLHTNAVLGIGMVDVAAGDIAVAQVPWVPTAPDTHAIQVQVSPYILEESDYANNTTSRVIVLGTPVSVDLDGAPTRLRFDPPYPNPTSRGVHFSFSVPQQSAGVLDIYDVLGRRVHGWRWTALAPGSHSVEWDGRGASGQRLGPGVYLGRLTVGDRSLQRKVILLH